LTKSAVNKCLYELSKRGQAVIVDTIITSNNDNNTTHGPPLWSPTCASLAKNYQQEHDRLLDVIQGSGDHGASTFSISLALQKSTSLINQMLYQLLEDGHVEKIHNAPPAWRVRKNTKRAGSTTCNNKQNATSTQSDIDSSGSLSSSSSDGGAPEGKRRRLNSPENDDSPENVAVVDTPILEKHHHKNSDKSSDEAWTRKCADIVWKKYKELHPNPRDSDIVAGFLLRRKETPNAPQLVALGSGTSIASGDHYSLEGYTVHDSHAEVVAQKSLVRWLYAQIEAATNSGKESVVLRSEDSSGRPPYALKKSFELWLYISQAPCGDSAVYSEYDTKNIKNKGEAKLDRMNKQNKGRMKQKFNAGKFRTKTEAGNGTQLTPQK